MASLLPQQAWSHRYQRPLETTLCGNKRLYSMLRVTLPGTTPTSTFTRQSHGGNLLKIAAIAIFRDCRALLTQDRTYLNSFKSRRFTQRASIRRKLRIQKGPQVSNALMRSGTLSSNTISQSSLGQLPNKQSSLSVLQAHGGLMILITSPLSSSKIYRICSSRRIGSV